MQQTNNSNYKMFQYYLKLNAKKAALATIIRIVHSSGITFKLFIFIDIAVL